VHGVGPVSDADGKDGSDASFKSAFEKRSAVFVVARTVEMGVGVDHRYPPESVQETQGQ
jgi:hypothetical protein